MNSARRTKVCKAVQTGAFVAVLVASFMLFNRVFCFKFVDGIYQMWAFYRLPKNNVDVLFVGSSHIFVNVNTGVLWDEYGMASFDLAGSVQPIWNSYYYIKEALKSQRPRLVVLDMNRVMENRDYIDSGRIAANNFGLRLSLDKIRSVKASSPKEVLTHYLLEFPLYHSRYAELVETDFFPSRGAQSFMNNTSSAVKVISYNYWKGHVTYSTRERKIPRPKDFKTNETGTLTPKVETYLNNICALCKENGIPLLFIKTPGGTNINETKMYNRAAQIGENYGVSTVNFNYLIDDIGMDYNSHFADRGHMNHKGYVVFTRYLGRYIKSRYDIPDRRGERGYESYDIMAKDEADKVKELQAQLDKAKAEKQSKISGK